MHLGPWRVNNCFEVTVTLTSGFSSSKVEPRAYLYIIWGKNPKFGVRIYFGIMACRIHFWVSLKCSLYINMYKNIVALVLQLYKKCHDCPSMNDQVQLEWYWPTSNQTEILLKFLRNRCMSTFTPKCSCHLLICCQVNKVNSPVGPTSILYHRQKGCA